MLLLLRRHRTTTTLPATGTAVGDSTALALAGISAIIETIGLSAADSSALALALLAYCMTGVAPGDSLAFGLTRLDAARILALAMSTRLYALSFSTRQHDYKMAEGQVAVKQTIRVFRGENPVFRFTINPVEPITGWQFVFTISEAANSSTKLLTATPSIVDGPGGVIEIAVPSGALDLEPDYHYYHDIFRIDNGKHELMSYGPFVVDKDAKYPLT